MFKRLRRHLPTGRSVLRIAVIIAITFPLWWKLGSLVPGFSQPEVSAASQSSSLSAITNNPLYAPHKLLSLASNKLLPGVDAAPRLPSILFSFIILISLYYILQRWFGRTIAALAGLIAATTPWLVLASRSVTPEIMLALPLAIGAILLGLQRAQRFKTILSLGLGIVAAACIYSPGGIWLVAVLLILYRKIIKSSAQDIGKWRSFGIIAATLVLLAPLIWKMASDLNLARNVLAIPQNIPAPMELIKNFGWQLLALAWKTPYHLDWTLGRLPILSVIQVVLLVFGTYAMYTLAKPKAQILLGLAFIGLVLGSFNHNFSFALVTLAPLFILMAAGLRYLYFQWRGVFPKNPIPKFLAMMIIVSLSGLQVLYGLRFSLIAWPHQPATASAYHATIKE